MVGSTVEVGRFGEGVVAAYLSQKKTHSTRYLPRPSKRQIRRLIYAANSFIISQRINANRIRFDLIRVSTHKNSVKVDHLEDVFDPASFLI